MAFCPNCWAFIAYASEFGRSDSDKGASSGPYAAALATEIVKPGLDHLGLFQSVKEAVIAATGGAQRPGRAMACRDGSMWRD